MRSKVNLPQALPAFIWHFLKAYRRESEEGGERSGEGSSGEGSKWRGVNGEGSGCLFHNTFL